MDGLFKPPIFSMGIHSVPTYMDHGLSIQLNKPGYKDCFGRKKMEARRKEILRRTTVVSRTPHTLISVDLQTYLQDKIFFFKFPWNLFPAREEAAKYSKKRRLTLRPLVEDTSDKSQTLEGVTLEQKTSYLICIWTLQGSLVNLSIYIFEFVGCSEK